MLSKVILFLVRRKLNLKRHDKFKFINQKEDCYYYFDSHKINKVYEANPTVILNSNVSLNWLLSNKCKIRKCNTTVKDDSCDSKHQRMCHNILDVITKEI